MVAGVDVWPKRARPQSSTESSRRELRKLRVAIIHSFKIKPSDIEQPGRPAAAAEAAMPALNRSLRVKSLISGHYGQQYHIVPRCPWSEGARSDGVSPNGEEFAAAWTAKAVFSRAAERVLAR